ncbi:hypothetical protein [Mycolicibacterium thermoresistibile]|uniref:hypothetical protein n=1 Tax=Mycolicibacterium thermoresistibile TaxID=1797 RepID=UPI001039D2D6|nr:hypothetical protein [Mycolicibacterium thermoresistibile]MCV7187045.1 hypothetical protein [Mycolicibacterium thermoresistibile]
MELTDRVRRLIAIGAVVVVDDNPATEPVEQADSTPDGGGLLPPGPNLADSADLTPLEPLMIEPPALNASRRAWAEFLTSRGIEFDDDAIRDDLIEIWENHSGGDG